MKKVVNKHFKKQKLTCNAVDVAVGDEQVRQLEQVRLKPFDRRDEIEPVGL
jgi:hypothetical protein